MVNVPVRAPPAGFAATTKPMRPLPIPDPGNRFIRNGELLVAFHAHPGLFGWRNPGPAPPAAGILIDVGARVNWPPAVAATWITVNACPPTTNPPVRRTPGFGATENVMLALPLPDGLD